MKRLLATITNSPFGFGGVSTWIERITRTLPDFHWQVTTVTHSPDEAHLADWKTRHPELLLRPLYGRFPRLSDIEQELEKYLEREHPDVVMINGSYWMIPVLQRLKQWGQAVRIVGVCHADDNGYYSGLSFYKDAIDHVIGVSEVCYNKLLALGFPPERTSLVTYGVPVSAVLPHRSYEPPLRLAYVGRLVQWQKRIFDFVPLLQLLNQRGVNYHLDLYGEGEDESALREQVERIDQQGRVTFHGWIPAAQVTASVWPHVDAALLLSGYEGLSVSMLEAMGCGVVPIVSHVESGVDQVIVEGSTGLSFPVGDMSACANQIEVVANDREKLMNMSQSGWELVSRDYSIAVNTQRLAGLLDKVAASPAQIAAVRYMGITSHPLAHLLPGWAFVLGRRLLKRGNLRNEGYTVYP